MQFAKMLVSFVGLVIFAALSGFPGDGALAETVSVKSGKPTVIGLIGQYDGANCSSMLPKAKMTGKAENGEVSLKWTKFALKSGSCKGKRIDVIVVTYRPKRGFSGTDKVRVAYRSPRRRFAQSETAVVRTKKYSVHVK